MTTNFELWATHYDTYLKRLYGVFQTTCHQKRLKWYQQLDFETFRDFVYEYSSGYLSPWL